jgi:hypothetical protein
MAARDIILIGVLVLVFGIMFFASHYVINEAYDVLINNTQINATPQATEAMQNAKNLTNRFDYIVFALFIGLGLALIITGWFVAGNPIFSFIYVLIIIIGVGLSTVFANVWETVTQQSVFGNTISFFPFTNNLILLLPIYIAVVGFIGIVVMFAKPYQGGQP